MFKFISKVVSVLFIVAISSSISAQKLDLNSSIPIDPNVTKGTLDNGLTYYIRANSKPEDKVELRLVVNAGSILENEDQLGLAHFMEHMNFNGLEHFPKHELVDYLQNIGVKFGADLNANTSFNRTYYILPIPTDNPENIQKGFQILADWAGGALVTDEEVEAERKVILEEMRIHKESASNRMLREFLPPLMNGSRYADRLPIGTEEVLKNCDPELIRQYYKDWYRPNNMAVIVVGDLSTEKAKSLVEKYFSELENPENGPERKYYKVEPYSKADAIVVTDPEAMRYSLGLVFPAKDRKVSTKLNDYRQSLVRRVFVQTLNHQLHKKSQVANPPYVGAGVSLSGLFGSFTLKQEGFNLNLIPINNFEVAIDSAIAVLLRAKEFGFSNNDIQNTIQEMLSSYEKMYNEKSKTLSSSYVGEYTRNFMKGEPIPGIENEYKYAKAMLPTITSKEVSELATKVLSNSKNFFALVQGPEDGDINLPSKEEFIEIIQKAFQQEVTEVEEKKGTSQLLTTVPTPGKITSESTDEDLGTTTYTLSNGTKVTVKPTDFKDDEIIFTATKFGGTNLYGVDDKSNAKFLTSVIESMGYGQFTPTELDEFLSGKTVSVSTSMGQLSNNISGSSSVKDFETLLKLNYLKLTTPRIDTGLFQGMLTKQKTRLQFLRANPQIAFVDSLRGLMYNNDPLAPIAIPTTQDLEKIDVERVIEMYKNQFGNADGYHFFIVGNVDKVDIKPLIEKYIAGLPSKGEKPMYKDNGVRMLEGDKTFKFYKGSNDRSLILSLYHGDNIEYSEEIALQADLLGQLMTIQINDVIREEMQAIYGGSAMANVQKLPYVQYSVVMQLPTGPDKVESILEELNKEIKEYKTTGGPKGNLKKAQKATLEGHKEDLQKNDYWASKLEDIKVWGKSKEFFLNFDDKVNDVTNEDIIAIAKILLNGDHFLAISFPEKSEK